MGQSTDGTNFASTHTKMGTSAFSIHAKDHTELATFGVRNRADSAYNNYTEINSSSTSGTLLSRYKSDGNAYSDPFIAMNGAADEDGATRAYSIMRAKAYTKLSGAEKYRTAQVWTESKETVSGSTSTAECSAVMSAQGAWVRVNDWDTDKPEIILGGVVVSTSEDADSGTRMARVYRYKLDQLLLGPQVWTFAAPSGMASDPVCSAEGWQTCLVMSGLRTGWGNSSDGAGYTYAAQNCDNFFRPTTWMSKTDATFTVKAEGFFRLTLQVQGVAPERIGCAFFIGGKEGPGCFVQSKGGDTTAIAVCHKFFKSGTVITPKFYCSGASGTKQYRNADTRSWLMVEYLGATGAVC